MPHPTCPRIYVGNAHTHVVGGQRIRPWACAANLTLRGVKVMELNLLKVHRALAANELALRQQDPSRHFDKLNTVIASMTFCVCINKGGRDVYLPVTIPIKPDGAAFCNFDHAAQALKKGRAIATTAQAITAHRALMKAHHDKGARVITTHPAPYVSSQFCGHLPKFDGSTGDPQLVRHSEPAIYTWLSTDAGIDMLINRLADRLRSVYGVSAGANVRVRNVMLHMHSTRTPCGPCERETVGIQNSHGAASFLGRLKAKLRGRRLQDVHGNPFSMLTFSTPDSIPMCTTYSADIRDSHHRARVGRYATTNTIELSDPLNANHVFLFHSENFKSQYMTPSDNLEDYAIWASASDSSGDCRTVAARGAQRIVKAAGAAADFDAVGIAIP